MVTTTPTTHDPDADQIDLPLAVIGGGPAGMRLAILLAGQPREVLLFDELSPGGQLLSLGQLAGAGAQPGVAGPDLATDMLEELLGAGIDIRSESIGSITAGENGSWMLAADGGPVRAAAVVIATGADHGEIGLADAERYVGRGVSFCAGCDAPMYADTDVAVVGAGPWAISDAVGLAAHAARVHVIGPVPEDAALSSQPRLSVYRAQSPVALIEEGGRVAGLRVTGADGNEQRLDVSGVFVSAAPRPRSGLLAGVAEVDDSGRVCVDGELRAGVRLYAIGDVRAGTPGTVAAAIEDAETLAPVLGRDLGKDNQ